MWLRHGRSSLVALGVASVLAGRAVAAQTGSLAVDTRTNVFLAGGNSYTGSGAVGAGFIPSMISLSAGTGRVMQLSATGSSFFCFQVACQAATPDGLLTTATNVNGAGSIGGVSAPYAGFLAALFLGPSLPSSQPAQFVVTDAAAPSFAPGLGQAFFVGDGLTTGTTMQQFLVPDGATVLYFGLVDGASFGGDPGFYDDNLGTYDVEYAITGAPSTTVPEPSTVALVSAGLAAVLAFRKRRAA